jgi:SAM-dependent methyltransferase
MRFPKEHRDRGILADEYRLVKLAYPHMDEFQGIVGECIKGYCPRQDVDKIQVLEVGCGDGLTTSIILEAREGIFLTAIDIEPAMLALAKANLARVSEIVCKPEIKLRCDA